MQPWIYFMLTVCKLWYSCLTFFIDCQFFWSLETPLWERGTVFLSGTFFFSRWRLSLECLRVGIANDTKSRHRGQISMVSLVCTQRKLKGVWTYFWTEVHLPLSVVFSYGKETSGMCPFHSSKSTRMETPDFLTPSCLALQRDLQVSKCLDVPIQPKSCKQILQVTRVISQKGVEWWGYSWLVVGKLHRK